MIDIFRLPLKRGLIIARRLIHPVIAWNQQHCEIRTHFESPLTLVRRKVSRLSCVWILESWQRARSKKSIATDQTPCEKRNNQELCRGARCFVYVFATSVQLARRWMKCVKRQHNESRAIEWFIHTDKWENEKLSGFPHTLTHTDVGCESPDPSRFLFTFSHAWPDVGPSDGDHLPFAYVQLESPFMGTKRAENFPSRIYFSFRISPLSRARESSNCTARGMKFLAIDGEPSFALLEWNDRGQSARSGEKTFVTFDHVRVRHFALSVNLEPRVSSRDVVNPSMMWREWDYDTER